MKFLKEELQAMVGEDSRALEKVEDEIVDIGRWAISHHTVFKDNESGAFYSVYYRVGATECQNERPFEYDRGIIECDEVFPVTVSKVVYMTAAERAKHEKEV